MPDDWEYAIGLSTSTNNSYPTFFGSAGNPYRDYEFFAWAGAVFNDSFKNTLEIKIRENVSIPWGNAESLTPNYGGGKIPAKAITDENWSKEGGNWEK